MFSALGNLSVQSLIQMAIKEVVQVLFQAASLVIDTIRTFFLVVLSVLGPLAFALSVFDGLHSTLVQWISRYISVSLWLPVSDLFGCMLSKIQSMIMEKDIERMSDPLSWIHADGSETIYIVFMLIGIVGYFCIPTVSSWIIHAGGMSVYNRNVNNTVTKAGNVVGAAAGASSGNVAGVLLKK